MTKSTAIAKVESYNILAPIENGLSPQQVMEENFGGEKLSVQDLTRVTIPGAGGTRWTVPSVEGEEDVEAITGVIVHQMASRAFWKQSFDATGGGTPPDCFSNDAINGTGDIGDGTMARMCATCPMSKFGSDGKRGQGCKESRILFVLREDDLLPLGVWLSPMSIAPWRKFTMQLAQKAKSLLATVIELRLAKDKNKDGITYAKVAPVYKGDLAAEVASRVRDYARGFKSLLVLQAADMVGTQVENGH